MGAVASPSQGERGPCEIGGKKSALAGWYFFYLEKKRDRRSTKKGKERRRSRAKKEKKEKRGGREANALREKGIDVNFVFTTMGRGKV